MARKSELHSALLTVFASVLTVWTVHHLTNLSRLSLLTEL